MPTLQVPSQLAVKPESLVSSLKGWSFVNPLKVRDFTHHTMRYAALLQIWIPGPRNTFYNCLNKLNKSHEYVLARYLHTSLAYNQ